ncbi:MAG TPA: VWA domain-containing protein [Blastocatellia bacterium]|nr:VWA domain-containing protein [Blastocatellia bacterium]
MKRLARFQLLVVFVLAFSAILPANLLGQEKSNKPVISASDDEGIQLGVSMVSLSVTVVDQSGNFVVGLNQNNFEVYEDKIKQDLVGFALDDAPLSVGIIFDLSGSMENKIRGSHDALKSFTRVCRDDDNIFLLGFNRKVSLLRDYTSDDGAILSSVLGAKAHGTTALYDAVYMGLEKAKQGRNARKVLLVISDGEDNSSRYTLREIKRLAQESDVVVYSIGIMDSGNMTPLDMEGADALNQLAEITGGKAFFPGTLDDLEAVTTYIALELRSQYNISFIPSNLARDGKWRSLKVRVHGPKSSALNVRARNGYFAIRS